MVDDAAKPSLEQWLSEAHDALGTLLDDWHEEFAGSDRVALEDALRVIREHEDGTS
jgi:hypothetical protein